MRETVNLVYRRGQLVFNFIGELEYDPWFNDRLYTGWRFDGRYFSASLWGNKAMELHKDENEFLCWSYRLLQKESPESFFLNLLNGLGK